MCGRIALYTPAPRLARIFEAQLGDDLEPEFRPSWNVGPTRSLLGLTPVGKGDDASGSAPPEDATVLHRYRWGLVPSWAKDRSIASKLFNARAETVAEKPSFRAAFKARRMAVVADGFYEWQKNGAARQPYYFTRADGLPLTFAGLWEGWRDPQQADDEDAWLHSCTVITTTGGPDIADVHDRMPVVLDADTRSIWLDQDAEREELHGILRPADEGTLVRRKVGLRVGNVRNDDATLIEEFED